MNQTFIPEDRTEDENCHSEWRPYCAMLTMVVTLVMVIINCILLACIVHAVQSTLADITVMLPEMRRTLLDLGQITPEVKHGMDQLNKICVRMQCLN
jgi:hypothetical protein